MPTLADSSLLNTRLRSVHARGRVADALLGVALDVVEPFATDYLSVDDYNALCRLVQAPVDDATKAALTTIARELALVVETDPDMRRRVQRGQHWRP